MREVAGLWVMMFLIGIPHALAEIPYVVKNGFEEVDYDKLNRSGVLSFQILGNFATPPGSMEKTPTIVETP